MTDSEKDLAIYKAMLGFANEIFSDAVDNSDTLRKLVSECGNIVSIKQLTNAKSDLRFAFNDAISMISGELLHIEVASFSCTLEVCSLFEHLEYQKSLAKVKGDVIFTYEEKFDNEFAGSVEVTIGDCNNAKLITKHVSNDELRPVMNYVVAEINATTQTVSFIASDGHTMCIISDNPEQLCVKPETYQTIYQAIFAPDDWKRICDYAKKNGGKVIFDIYRMKRDEMFDTFNVRLGDVRLRSRMENRRYPNWHSVIPSKERLKYRFSIVPDEWKTAQEWVKKIKDDYRSIRVSFYRGSDLVYFEYENCDFNQKKTATFHLTRRAQVTTGIAYSAERLKKIKFTGFNLEDYSHPTIVDCEEAGLMLVMPRLLDDESYVSDVENRECPYVFTVGEYAAWQTLDNDAAIVRIEAISGETACIRTVGWNRYRVPLSELQPTVEAKYSWPLWLHKGQYVSSDRYCGIITELGRTYVTIDNDKYVSYRDIIRDYLPSSQVLEMAAA